ncbi:DsrE family protein [bacterium]|nr:DsrE family protein [bacterium]
MSKARFSRTVPGLLILGLITALCCVVDNSRQTAQEKHRDGVFIHVSHGAEAPQRVLMALSMAGKMCEDKDVLVYFDITGVQVVLNETPDITFGDFPACQAQLKALLEKGVELYVCPGCLKAAGKGEADVMAGVKIAEKEAFFDFTEGRILTLDY